jgi:hypothetical protein
MTMWSRFIALPLLLLSSTAAAETWIDSVESQLYCTRLASPAERASLKLTFSRGKDPAYWNSPSRSGAERLQKHLLMLGAIAYLADSSNNQDLRRQALLHAALTARSQSAVNPVALRQLLLCAHAALMSANVEMDNPAGQHEIADDLILEYSKTPVGPAVEDLPLVHALREASLGPRSESIRQLAGLAYVRAEGVKARDPERAGRLLSASAQALSAQGDTARAFELVRLSNSLVSSRDRLVRSQRAWSNFPVLYDGTNSLQGKAAAHQLAGAMLQELGAPPDSADAEELHAVYRRLAEFAWEQVAAGGPAEQQRYVDFSTLARRNAQQDFVSVSFLRAALTALDVDRDGLAAQNYVWKQSRTVAENNYRDAYRPQFNKYVEQSQSAAIGDIRTHLVQRSKLENWLETLSRLSAVLPAERPEIVDLAFKGLQLQSHSSVSAATMKGYVRRSSGDPKTRESILRFLTMQADPSFAVGRALERVYNAGFKEPAADAVLRDMFVGLDISYNESSKAILEFRKFIWSRAPDLRGLILGSPGPVAGAQALLKDDEALVAFLPTDSALLIFGITRTAAVLERSELSRAELVALVSRLRASIMPDDAGSSISVKTFDAAAAFELYSQTAGRIGTTIAGKKHLFWYSGPDMASVPPSLLIDRKPPKPLIADPAELARLPWFADRHAVSVLPEPHLFWIFRGARVPPKQPYAFIGVGAPQLSLAELQGARESRSMELAGGLDGAALADLPKLPEAADELRNMAAILVPGKTALLMGAEATKPAVKALLTQGGEIVSFATHGFVANEIFGVSEPSLLLAGGDPDASPLQSLLTTGEIFDLELNSRLVILSACNTATSDGRPRGASFTGLSQSFTSAGARSLLVSHWPVASMAATELSVTTVKNAREGKQELAMALRDAMRTFRTTYPEYSHPFYWAPFVFVGDGRQTLQ